MTKTVTASLLLVALSAAAGCRVEQAPSRAERAESHMARLADTPLPILPQPDVDDAANVVAACGRPVADSVETISSKYYNGPVRRLKYFDDHYRVKRPVTIDFIPSRPRAELASEEAPLPIREDARRTVPPDATWRFQAGHMEQEYLITAYRLGHYLPCAGEALRGEF